MAFASCQSDRLMEMNRESIPNESADTTPLDTMPLDSMLLVEIEEGQLGADLEVLDEPPASEASPLQARPDPMYHAVILTLACGVLVLAAVLSVRNSTEVLLPVFGVPLPELCMSKRYLGFDCPGCGLTRCFISLARGDLSAAWQYNPAGLWLFGMLAAQIPYRILQLVRIRRGMPELTTGSLAQWLFGILGVLLVGQWLLRLVGIPF